MLKQLTFIATLLFALWGQAQTETSFRHIDVLAYNTEGDLYFYWQKGKDKFLELELDYEEDEKADYKQELYDLKLTYNDKEDWETLKDIKRGEKKIIYLKDIQRTTLKDFVGKTFKTLPPIYDKNTQTILKILNPQLALLCDIDIEEKDPYQDRDYYSLRAINLGKGRNIYLLSDNSYIEGFIVPLKDKTLFLNDRETTKLMVTQYPSSYKDDFINYKPKEYMLLRPKGKRYELINIYKQKVLSGRYDTIYYNEFGIIGKRGHKYVLYDSYLQKKKFKGMQSVYFYRDGIEMLNREGAGYYQISGERIEAFPKIVYYLCVQCMRRAIHWKKTLIRENTHTIYFIVLEVLLLSMKLRRSIISRIEVLRKLFRLSMVNIVLYGTRMTLLRALSIPTLSLYEYNKAISMDFLATPTKRSWKGATI